MPSKHYEILDEGVIKNIDHNKMRDTIYYNLIKQYEQEYWAYRATIDWNKTQYDLLKKWELDIEKFRILASEDPYKPYELGYKQPVKPRIVIKSIDKILEPPETMSKKAIFNYFNEEIYNHCWMLNISPNWPDKMRGNKKFEQDCIEHIQEVMGEFYTDANRFTKMKYVIECGKNGDFIHAHAVFELNPKKANNISHMKKGNFLKSFRTIWDRTDNGWAEGLVGYKHALQTTYLTTKEMLNDKLDYLIEEKKPISHQNAEHELLPILVNQWD